MVAHTERIAHLEAEIKPGEYLVEDTGGYCVLWRISGGEPRDGALDPAPAWAYGCLMKASKTC